MLNLADLRVAATDLDHPEGLTADAHGTVWSGGQSGQLYELDIVDASRREVLRTGGALLGVCLDAAGTVYACDVNLHAVVRATPATGEWEVLSRGCPQRPFVSPNWPVLDDHGNLFVTESGLVDEAAGWIAKITPDGETTLWSEECVEFPNTAALAVDGSALFVVESTGPGVVRIPILADGSAGRREVVVDTPGIVPDGLVMLADGTFLICCYRPDRIVHVDLSGTITTLLDDPRGIALNTPTSGVLVGPRRTTLVIASLGAHTVRQIEIPFAGAPLRYPARGPSTSRTVPSAAER
jgi:gluconolactonase